MVSSMNFDSFWNWKVQMGYKYYLFGYLFINRLQLNQFGICISMLENHDFIYLVLDAGSKGSSKQDVCLRGDLASVIFFE